MWGMTTPYSDGFATKESAVAYQDGTPNRRLGWIGFPTGISGAYSLFIHLSQPLSLYSRELAVITRIPAE
jgi:hypothetical protein